jgi:hypothetical protein
VKPSLFERLDTSDPAGFCTELVGEWPDATALMAHLCRLNGLRFLSKRSYPMIDDVEIWFEYLGYRFSITSPMARFWLKSEGGEFPEEVFRKVESHFICYQAVSPWTYFRMSLFSLFRLPRRAPTGSHAARSEAGKRPEGLSAGA